MGKKILASVAEVDLFYKKAGELALFASANTLTDTALSFTNSMEEVRGGQGAKLFTRYGHTSGVTLQMTDIILDMNYFKALIGAELSKNDAQLNDVHTVANVAFTSGSATLATTEPLPMAVSALCGADKIVAWAYKAGCDEDSSKFYVVTCNNRALTGETGMPDGNYCVKYFAHVTEGTYAKINAKFQPMELFARLRIQEFAADASASTSDGVVGHLIFNFPRYQFDGSFDLSLTMTSNATISLNGTVLAVPAGDCEGGDYYGEVMEIPVGASTADADFREGLTDIIVDPTFLTTDNEPHVWGIYPDGAHMIDNAKIAAQVCEDGNFNGFTTALTNGKWTAGDDQKVVIAKIGENKPTSPQYADALTVETVSVSAPSAD